MELGNNTASAARSPRSRAKAPSIRWRVSRALGSKWIKASNQGLPSSVGATCGLITPTSLAAG